MPAEAPAEGLCSQRHFFGRFAGEVRGAVEAEQLAGGSAGFHHAIGHERELLAGFQ